MSVRKREVPDLTDEETVSELRTAVANVIATREQKLDGRRKSLEDYRRAGLELFAARVRARSHWKALVTDDERECLYRALVDVDPHMRWVLIGD